MSMEDRRTGGKIGTWWMMMMKMMMKMIMDEDDKTEMIRRR